MGKVMGADAVCWSRGCILSARPLLPPAHCHPPRPDLLMDAEPLPSSVVFPSSCRAPDLGVCEGQGALHPKHSPSRLVPIPRMLFPDAAGLLGQQEGWEGRHTVAVAPRCLLTRLPVLPAAHEPVPQEAAIRESILLAPPGKAGTDHRLFHPTRNVGFPPQFELWATGSRWNRPAQAAFQWEIYPVGPRQSCQLPALRRGRQG